MNFKIIITIFVAIFFVSVIFAFSKDLYINAYDPDWRGIINAFSTHAEKKKIFIIGSSSEYAINSTKINEFLAQNNKNYEVYDLADMSDVPTKRLKSIQNIISNKPEVVVYGLGIVEFEKQKPNKDSLEQSINFILNPHDYFTYIFDELTENSFQQQFPTSPRDRTLLLVKYILRGPDYIYHPFINFKESPINDYATISKTYNAPISVSMDNSENNEQIVALKEIISTLKQNSIKIVLFTNPHHKIIIDNISDSEMQKYTSMLKKVASDYHTDIFFLHDKYVDMNIWRDPYHIAIQPQGSVFTNDIQKIIVQELEN